MAEAVLTGLPGLATAMPAPPASVDPYLDAAMACFTRHGVGRTSVQDIARELRVDRTTVYRQVGNVPSIVRLLSARELHRMLAALPEQVTGLHGPELIVDLLVATITFALEHPVLQKALRDEPELIGPYLIAEAPAMIDVIAFAAAPLLQAAMDAGEIARRDPVAISQAVVRLAMALVLAPPPGDLRPVVAAVVLPMLSPD